MKKIFIMLMFIVFASFYLTSCSCTRVDPGHVGIKVNMTGGDRGVEPTVLGTGWVFYMPFFTKIFEYPTFVQTTVWTRSVDEGKAINEELSFNSKEGLTITADISLSYQLDESKIPAFYVKFRNDDLSLFTHGYLRNIARDIFNEVAGAYSVEDVYGNQKEKLLVEVRKRLTDAVKDIGVSIQQFGFVGAPRPPQAVIAALNAKVASTQAAMQSENELRQAQAEAKKNVAKAEGDANARMARAEAEAKANLLIAKSITPELTRYLAITKWDGILPKVTGSSVPMINIDK